MHFLIQAFSQQDVVSWEKRSQKVAGNDQIRESPASFQASSPLSLLVVGFFQEQHKQVVVSFFSAGRVLL